MTKMVTLVCKPLKPGIFSFKAYDVNEATMDQGLYCARLCLKHVEFNAIKSHNVSLRGRNYCTDFFF